LFLVSLDVFLNDFEFLLLSCKSHLIGFFDMGLLVDLSVNCALEGLDFFFLDKKLLSLLEAFNLLLDDLNFFSLFLHFLFLGADDDFSNSDLFFD